MTEYICETEKWDDTFDEPVIRWNEPIVRCRDCKWFVEPYECRFFNDAFVDGSGFCAWGEREDGR